MEMYESIFKGRIVVRIMIIATRFE